MTTHFSNAFLLSLLVAYIAIHMTIQLTLASGMSYDHAEQVLLMQHGWSWGYLLSQPPFYTWLGLLSGAVLGLNIFAVTVLAYSLQAATFILLYATARRVLQSRPLVVLTVLSYATTSFFLYRVQQNMTHSVLVAFMIVATLYVLVRLLEQPKWLWYVALGVCFGLGSLSKWNYLLMPASVMLALAIVSRFRTYLFDRKFLATLFTMGVIIAGPLWWLIDNDHSWLFLMTECLSTESLNSYFSKIGSGVWLLLSRSLGFLGFYLLLFLLIMGEPFYQGWKRCCRSGIELTLAPGVVLIGVVFLVALTILLLGLFSGIVTRFRTHWLLMPMLLLPLLGFAIVDVVQPSAQRVKAFFLASIAVIMLGIGAAWLQYTQAGDSCRGCQRLLPFHQMSTLLSQPQAQAFDGILLTNSPSVSGNLRLYYPKATVMVARNDAYNMLVRSHVGQELLIIYQLGVGGEHILPEELEQSLQRLHLPNGVSMVQSGFIELSIAGSKQGRKMPFYYAYYA